jgi:hypothetical protein
VEERRSLFSQTRLNSVQNADLVTRTIVLAYGEHDLLELNLDHEELQDLHHEFAQPLPHQG